MTPQMTTIELDEPKSLGYPIRLPQPKATLRQDEEWCEIYMDSSWRRLRLHDYGDIYRVPNLYEHIFADLLRCTSPQRVVGQLGDVMRDAGQSPTTLSVIDIGAGNGMVGEQLRALGVRALVGVDIIPEAAEAAGRDRPELYDDYLVADLCNLDESEQQRLRAFRPNCLCTVSALGFGDIPPGAFRTAFDAISTPGWLAFNIKETFLEGTDHSGFSRLIRAMSDNGIIQIDAYRRYCHRLAVTGQPLKYVAMTARKLRELPEKMVREAQ